MVPAQPAGGGVVDIEQQGHRIQRADQPVPPAQPLAIRIIDERFDRSRVRGNEPALLPCGQRPAQVIGGSALGENDPLSGIILVVRMKAPDHGRDQPLFRGDKFQVHSTVSHARRST